MIPSMALKPGGGRSPSTQTPPRPSTNGRHRPTRDRRAPETPRLAAISVMRWGVLIGGLVIIADLATQAILQRTTSPDDVNTLVAVDQIINWILFSILGIIVVRDTGLFYLGAIAGAFASVLDSIVVVAAGIMAPPAGGQLSILDVIANNLEIGILFAGASGGVYAIVRRWSGQSRGR
jgi:hypothetical protein